MKNMNKHEKRCVHTYVNAYIHMRRDTPSPSPAFWMNLPSPDQLRTYLIDGPFFNQKIHKEIRILYTLKYKLSKK